MKFKLAVVTAIILGLSLFAIGQNTFRNPVISGLASDPSICRVGDDYFLVTSTFEMFPGLPIYQSKDLVHWKLICYALSRASQDPLIGCETGFGGLYAPTIRYDKGIFYIVCTNYGEQGAKGAFYVTATDPAGNWSEPHWVDNWGADASLLFANDSVYYIHPAGCDGYYMQSTLNLKTGKFNNPEVKLVDGTGGACPEGPHMYKINDYYYLMAAEGGTGYQHKETMQRSKSPWGPFEISPINPIISHEKYPVNPFQALGHADLIETPDGWWLVCLGIRPKGGNYHHLGRETFLAPVTWNADGWPKVGTDGTITEEMKAPNLPQHIWEKDPVRDEFDNTTLRLQWNFVRNPYSNDWSLSSKPGFLHLNGSAINFTAKNSPAFVCRRQTAFNMVASTKISFIPTKTNEEAGLVVRGDDKNRYDFLITQLSGKRVIMLRKVFSENVASLNYKEITEGDVVLRISATDLEYKFWIQEEGKNAELIASAPTKDLSTERIGGFIGVFIGMYASGNGTKNANPADFDWFDFEEDPTLPYSWTLGEKEMQNNMETPSILSTASSDFDQAKITWNNIANETGYIIQRFNGTQFDSIASKLANDTVYSDSGLKGSTIYHYRIVGKNSLGYSLPSVSVSVLTLHAPGSYLGSPSQIPGKIEAENFDSGKNGTSYFDTDAGNNGGQYRTDDVDMENCADEGNGFDIGWTQAGEWLNYTVDVNDSISNIEMRVASPSGGSFRLDLNGKEIAKITVPVTGGYQAWKTVTAKNIKMGIGKNQKLKVHYIQGNVNFNWINFIKINQTGFPEMKSEGIRVYPNPTNGILRIESAKGLLSKVEIYTLSGELVKTVKLNDQITVDVSGLAIGTYLGKAYAKNGEFFSFKFMKK